MNVRRLTILWTGCLVSLAWLLLQYAPGSAEPTPVILSAPNVGWEVECVSCPSADAGGLPSLALDVQGNPQVAFLSDPYPPANLMHARWDGSAWEIQTVDGGGSVEAWISMDVEPDGTPHIAYFDEGLNVVRYARWTGSSWDIQTIGPAIIGSGLGNVSLVLDSTGYPHLAYYNGPLYHVYWDGSTWIYQVVDNSGGSPGVISLVMDSMDYAHISYNLNHNIKYAYWDGIGWSIQTLAYEVGTYISDNSLALDSLGNPHICYRDYTNDAVMYATWTDGSWDIQAVAEAGIEPSNSLALDSMDYPHISYFSHDDGSLMYASWDGTRWFSSRVIGIEPGGYGEVTRLALDAADKPYLSYYDSNTHDIMLAHYSADHVAPESVDLSGPDNGYIQSISTFTATVSPISTTLPIWYMWEATGNHLIIHPGGFVDTVSFVWDTLGTKVITVTANNGLWEVYDTHVVTITEEPITGLRAVNNSPTYLGEKTRLEAIVSGGTRITYAWDFGDGASGNGVSVRHTYPDIGLYTATVTATNSLGSETATTLVTITDAPIIGLIAVNDSPTTLGEVTALTATVTAGTNIGYAWDFGDGSAGVGAVVVHTYPEVGLYTATVTATNGLGREYATTSVSITDVPIAGLTVVNDSPTTLGEVTFLTATVSTGTNITYAWDFGDGATGNDGVVTHTYTAVGNYTATVTATNSTSSQIASTLVAITDVPIAGLTAVNDSPTVLGEITTLTATVSAGTNIGYAWDFGDGFTGIGAVVGHIYPEVGLYTSTVTATNGLGSERATTLISILDAPIAGLTAFNDSPTTLGDVTTLTASVAAGTNITYAWDFGDGTSGNGATVTHTYPDIGLYTATVTATNSLGSETATTLVTITDVPITGLVALNDSSTTLGEVTTLTATVTAGTNIGYAWDFGDGSAGVGAVVVHTYPEVGLYTATVTATNGLGSEYATTFVSITDVPIAGLTVVNDSPTTLGEVTFLTATVSTGTNITYAWDFGDGATGNDGVVTHTYTAVGNYTATVTATNSVSSQTASTLVTISDVPITGLTAVNDSPTTLGEITTLTATVSAGTNVIYTWDFGDGLSGLGAVVEHIYPDVGLFTATVTATNGVGSEAATSGVSITDVPIAGLTAVNESPSTLGEITTLTATVTAGTNIIFTWDFGDGSAGVGVVVAHTYPEVGLYTSTVTAANSVGSQIASTLVTITDVPITGLTAVNDSPTMLGEITILTATVTAGTNITYAWDFGDGTSGDGAIVTHIYPDLGLYTATVTATNSVSSQTASTLVTITDVPIADLSAVNNSPTVLGEVTTLTATVTAGTNIIYTWDFGDGLTGLGAVVVHAYPDVGLFTATVTATNGLGSETATTGVSITNVPIAGLTAVNDSPTNLGEVTTFTTTVTAGTNVIYTWDFGDGTTGSGAVVTHTYATTGEFTATVTASNGVSNMSVTTPVTVLPAGPANRIFLPVVTKQ
jgi:PKD repeat protein